MARPLMELKVVSLGRVYGNVPLDTLVRLAMEGRISADDQVRPKGTKEWQAAGEFPGLAAVVRRRPAGGEYGEFNEDDFAEGGPPQARKRQYEEAEMDMTPMIDCTFQLLIFFMLTNAVANPAPMDVPRVVHGRGVTLEGQQLVLIDADGRYYLGRSADKENLAADLPALVNEVRANVAANRTAPAQADGPQDAPGQPRRSAMTDGPGLECIVCAHKKARYTKLRELVEALGKVQGLGPVRIGVEEKLN